MPREMARRREARQAKFAAKSGLTTRRPIEVAEAETFFSGVDRKDLRGFGIRQLSDLAVDILLPAPRSVSWTENITLLDYTAWKNRDPHVNALLNAGADLTLGVLPTSAFDVLPRPYAAWIAKAAAAMRRYSLVDGVGGEIGAASSASTALSPSATVRPASPSCCAACRVPAVSEGCSDGVCLLTFTPCGHRCCPSCVWRRFASCAVQEGQSAGGSAREEEGDEEQTEIVVAGLPELLCPLCRIPYELPLPAHRSCSSGDSCKLQEDDVRCESRAHTEAVWGCFSGAFVWLRAFASCKKMAEERAAREREARRMASLERWRVLPAELPWSQDEVFELRPTTGESGDLRAGGAGKKPAKLKLGPFRAMGLQECASSRLGLTRSQRSEHLRRAADRGDARRVRALLQAGVDLYCADEYGHSPLFIAAWRGHTSVVELLLDWGVLPENSIANNGIGPHAAAVTGGHRAVLQVLGPGLSRLPDTLPEILANAGESHGNLTPIRGGPLLEGDAWRTFFIDGAFSDHFLDRLRELWQSLPVCAKEAEANGDAVADGGAPSIGRAAQARKKLQTRDDRKSDRSRKGGAPKRSYFCDIEGWVMGVLAAALRCEYHLAGDGSAKVSAPVETAYSHMRFLHYAEPDGCLAPHLDLSRTDAFTGLRSTHTFILYLDGAAAGAEPGGGGETVLLEKLDAASLAVATVAPARGRLFVFPHDWPHKAMPVVRPPKLLLRGEMR